MSNDSPVVGNTPTCPHCGAGNPIGAAFCQVCGKALPQQSKGPRIIEGETLATSSGGRQLQSDQLRRKARSASGALLAVAILTTLGLLLLYFVSRELMNDPRVGRTVTALLLSQAIVAVVYWALWIWSRSNPLPAAIVGLIIFLSLIAVNALTVGPETILQGLIIKIIVVLVLVRAIQAGAQHRALQQQIA